MHPSAMGFISRWGMPLINWWIIVCCASQIHHTYGTVTITKEDLLLLKDEEALKCFTRTQYDLTCFFEASDNRTYGLRYSVGSPKRCELFTQRTDEGTLLHVCSFPAADVLLFVEMLLEIVVHNNDTLLYKRTICVEEHFLLDPPFNVSLNYNGESGQLQLSWKSKVPDYFEDSMMFMIQHSSVSLGQKIKYVHVKQGDILDSVVPGEVTEVQVKTKCASSPAVGHWSRWSEPVRAMVPQSSGDISLTCTTADLHNITCMWNRSRYGPEDEYTLFYKTSLREDSSWSDWTECVAEENLPDLCRFHGHGTFRVKLCSDPFPLSRTFYSPESSVHKRIKTSPPNQLSREWRKNKLCLKWEAPLPILFAHLQYEVCYQIRGTDAWMILTVEGPETSTCVKLPLGSHYSAKVRAKPTGTIYSGDWSDWSDVVTGDTPADKSTFLLLFIPVSLLIVAIIAISLLPQYLSKLKLYFCPPVPNLDKVLQRYLADMNGQRWNSPPTAKPCLEEISPSFLEIMSEYEVAGKPSERSTQLPPAEQRSPLPEPDQPLVGEECPGYVMLRKGTFIHCPKANTYIHNSVHERQGCTEAVQTCTDGSEHPLLFPGNELMNQSYFPQAEPADGFKCGIPAIRGSGNLYTNLPCS